MSERKHAEDGRAAGRKGDRARADKEAPGCPSCPSQAEGPAQTGSPDVYVNEMAGLRVGDGGTHNSCGEPLAWKAVAGAPAVFFNGLRAHRTGDEVDHRGGRGELIDGSPDVLIGDRAHVAGSWGSVTETPRGVVRFRMLDPFGRARHRAMVVVHFADGSARRTTLDDDGGLELLDCPLGDYVVRVEGLCND